MGYIHISLQNMARVNKKRKLDDLDDLFTSSDEEPTMTGTRTDIPELDLDLAAKYPGMKSVHDRLWSFVNTFAYCYVVTMNLEKLIAK